MTSGSFPGHHNNRPASRYLEWNLCSAASKLPQCYHITSHLSIYNQVRLRIKQDFFCYIYIYWGSLNEWAFFFFFRKSQIIFSNFLNVNSALFRINIWSITNPEHSLFIDIAKYILYIYIYIFNEQKFSTVCLDCRRYQFHLCKEI